MKRVLTFLTLIFTPVLVLASGGEILFFFSFIFIYFLIGSLIIGFFDYKIISRRLNTKLNIGVFIGSNYLIIIYSTLLPLLLLNQAISIFGESFGGILLIFLIIIIQILSKTIIYIKFIIKTNLSIRNRILLIGFLCAESAIINALLLILFHDFNII